MKMTRFYHQTSPEGAARIQAEGFKLNGGAGKMLGDPTPIYGIYLKAEAKIIRPDILGAAQVKVTATINNAATFADKDEFEEWIYEHMDEAEWGGFTSPLSDFSTAKARGKHEEITARFAHRIADLLRANGHDAVTFADEIPDADGFEGSGEFIHTTVILDPKVIRV
jgi:hypothetical protein